MKWSLQAPLRKKILHLVSYTMPFLNLNLFLGVCMPALPMCISRPENAVFLALF